MCGSPVGPLNVEELRFRVDEGVGEVEVDTGGSAMSCEISWVDCLRFDIAKKNPAAVRATVAVIAMIGNDFICALMRNRTSITRSAI